MLHSAKSLEKTEIRGTDDIIGRIDDVLFDDRFWHVRYFVVDTGVWLSGRRVLISPLAIRAESSTDLSRLVAQLTQEQVRRSPSFDDKAPPTREQEATLHAHYQWPPYWAGAVPLSGDVLPDPVASPATANAGAADENRGEAPAAERRDAPTDAVDRLANDPHLRSAREVRGHRIAATDGEIGHVEDFLVDARTWQIRYLVVDTRNWWPGRKVVIAPMWLNRVSWTEKKVFVDLTRDAIKASPEYNEARTFTRDYADQLHRHYHREPHTW